ncbi:hypothetical protein EX895_005077 [Sporisorium graminicola]|uniref:Uncharacterized protein n=1 Tax=Sporisorium graminicola TaxID=280036 RepID=A0A4U7KTD6_9BASI|nr:hypothetical protein EX895_005077 [Sporisorium graminicola]TKY86252.1 hypothetical protein EX895_005077 [Sporisorium graminicola]
MPTMTDASPAVPSFIAFTNDGAQALLVLAPALLLGSVSRTPRTVFYIKSETLVLLTLVYTFRYSHLFTNSFNFDNILQYTHLWMLVQTTFTVHWLQTKAFIPKPAPADHSNDEEQDEVEKLLDPLPASFNPKPDPQRLTADVKRVITFDRRLFGNILLWSFLPTLYSGDHSLLSYAVDAYSHKSHAPLSQIIYSQLSIATCLLEINALVLLFGRVIIQRRGQINMPPPTETQLQNAKIDVEEWKKRLQTPNGVWAFMWFSMASAALALPGYIHKADRVKRPEDFEIAMWRTVASSMTLLMFAATMLFYRFMRPSRIQLPKDDEHVKAGSLA